MVKWEQNVARLKKLVPMDWARFSIHAFRAILGDRGTEICLVAKGLVVCSLEPNCVPFLLPTVLWHFLCLSKAGDTFFARLKKVSKETTPREEFVRRKVHSYF